MPDGAASKTNLRIGDRILEVNGKDMKDASHRDAVMALIAPTYEIRVIVRHDPPPKGLQVCNSSQVVSVGMETSCSRLYAGVLKKMEIGP